MATTIRQGAIGDLDALVAFDHIASSSEERRNQIESGLRDSEISVALVDGIPKGYALLNYRFYGQPFIELLYIAPESRRIGLASALVEHVQKHMFGSKLFTSTNQSNEPMRELLHKLGFEESGIIHNLDPVDPELVFLKRLQ
jgi:ribosomal protein S18 acetylase RimI-like enzyme